ncbi:MAG: DUF975 family protein [Lachnospiraceae bacterium]|nr:DUF975 family protein [Lachnospiraceae bacterium]
MTTLNIRDLKRAARQLLLGKYGILALVTFLLACSNFFLSSLSLLAVPEIGGLLGRVLDFAALLITNMVYTLLLAGMYYIYYRITEQEPIRFSDLLFAFRSHPEPVAAFSVLSLIVEYGVLNLLPLSYMKFGRSLPFAAVAIVLLLILLWYTMTFSAVLFFYATDPWHSVQDYLRQSMALMKGCRVKFFFLLLSFIGVFLLGLLSFGIGLVLVVPYMVMTQMLFFRARMGEDTNGL